MRVPRFVSSQTFHDVHCSSIPCNRCAYASYAEYDRDVLDGCELCAQWVAGVFPSKYFNDDDRRRYAAMMRKGARA